MASLTPGRCLQQNLIKEFSLVSSGVGIRVKCHNMISKRYFVVKPVVSAEYDRCSDIEVVIEQALFLYAFVRPLWSL